MLRRMVSWEAGLISCGTSGQWFDSTSAFQVSEAPWGLLNPQVPER